MPYKLPTTADLVKENLVNIESSLNCQTPPGDKAFNTVLATLEGMAGREMYAYANDLARENLALTASEEGLEMIGREYGLHRKKPAAWEGAGKFPLEDGLSLLYGTVFADKSGMEYETTQTCTAPSGYSGEGVVVPLKCTVSGAAGNKSPGNTLAIKKPVEGGGRELTITDVTLLGIPGENIDTFRQRVLDAERSEGGGGNACDYRIWAQEVPGVKRAYPFTGAPEGTERTITIRGVEGGPDREIPPEASVPGERTVYIECTPDINEDGIPPQELLNMVKAALTIDPETGKTREMLGLPKETLYVEPVKRINIYVNLIGIIIEGNIGEALKASKEAVRVFIDSFEPYVEGVDAEHERRDMLSSSVLIREIQNILDEFQATVQDVTFGLDGEVFRRRYDLKNNEKLRLISFTDNGREI